MYKAIKAMFNKSEDLRGNVTADQAMAYVKACTNEWSRYEPLSATPLDDGEQIMWEVLANYTPTGDGIRSQSAEEICFHVLKFDEGDNGFNTISSMPAIYGEW